MKITGIKFMSYTGEYKPEHPHESRSVGPLDFYDEFRQDGNRISPRDAGGRDGALITQSFLGEDTDAERIVKSEELTAFYL